MLFVRADPLLLIVCVPLNPRQTPPRMHALRTFAEAHSVCGGLAVSIYVRVLFCFSSTTTWGG